MIKWLRVEIIYRLSKMKESVKPTSVLQLPFCKLPTV